jgi:E3 ubiquitin-protein ligase UBR3
MVDADIFLLQVCATQLPSSIVLPTIFDRYVSPDQMNVLFDYLHDQTFYEFIPNFLGRFHVMEFLSLNPRTKSSFLEGEQESSMLESCLTFLASLMSIRTNIGKHLSFK